MTPMRSLLFEKTTCLRPHVRAGPLQRSLLLRALFRAFWALLRLCFYLYLLVRSGTPANRVVCLRGSAAVK